MFALAIDSFPDGEEPKPIVRKHYPSSALIEDANDNNSQKKKPRKTITSKYIKKKRNSLKSKEEELPQVTTSSSTTVDHTNCNGNALLSLIGISERKKKKKTHKSHGIPKVPRRLLRRYPQVEFIDMGTYGVVWKAIGNNGQKYAIKSQTYQGDEDGLTGVILREADILSRMHRHPCIANLRRVFHNERGEVDLVMRFYQHNLCEWISEHTWDIRQIYLKRIFRHLIDAVLSLHENGIFHFDLKPQNVLLDEETMLPAICDFGISSTGVLDINDDNVELCTVHCRPPELLAYKKILKTSTNHHHTEKNTENGSSSSLNTSYNDIGIQLEDSLDDLGRVDVWSLGCIFVQYILGNNPFLQGEDAKKTLNAILVEEEYLTEEDITFLGLEPKDYQSILQKHSSVYYHQNSNAITKKNTSRSGAAATMSFSLKERFPYAFNLLNFTRTGKTTSSSSTIDNNETNDPVRISSSSKSTNSNNNNNKTVKGMWDKIRTFAPDWYPILRGMLQIRNDKRFTMYQVWEKLRKTFPENTYVYRYRKSATSTTMMIDSYEELAKQGNSLNNPNNSSHETMMDPHDTKDILCQTSMKSPLPLKSSICSGYASYSGMEDDDDDVIDEDFNCDTEVSRDKLRFAYSSEILQKMEEMCSKGYTNANPLAIKLYVRFVNKFLSVGNGTMKLLPVALCCTYLAIKYLYYNYPRIKDIYPLDDDAVPKEQRDVYLDMEIEDLLEMERLILSTLYYRIGEKYRFTGPRT